jgi:hypothetical protein
MIWYVALDTAGRIKNVQAGVPHGNTQHFTTVEAERLVDAQELAPAAAAAYWATVRPGVAPRPAALPRPKPGPKPKEPRCKCGMPRPEEARQCLLCDELARTQPKAPDDAPRERRENDAVLVFALEVQRQWQQSPNVGLFTKWLGGRIAAMRSVR